MSDNLLDRDILGQAFRATGRHFKANADVDVLIVGGAALAMTSALPPGRTTVDCDVMDCDPEDAEKALVRAAAEAARELGLPHDWLDLHVQWHRDSLLEDWRDRRRLVGTYGRLRVYAAGRLDLTVMKADSRKTAGSRGCRCPDEGRGCQVRPRLPRGSQQEEFGGREDPGGL